MTGHQVVVDHIDATVYASAGCTCGATWECVNQPPHEAVRQAIRHVLEHDNTHK